MSEITTTELSLPDLDRHIEHLQSTAARIKRHRAPFERRVQTAVRRLRHLRFRKWLRAPSESFDLWRIGLTLVLAVPLLVFSLSFLTRDALAGSISAAPFVFGIIGVSIAGILVRCLYYPNDAELVARIDGTDRELRLAESELWNVRSSDGLGEVEQQLRVLLNDRERIWNLLREQRREQQRQLKAEIAALGRHRAKLMQRDWKAMRAYEWEQYLVEIFLALGASKAERIGGAGDQGVDLIVEMKGNRIAVQAKGYEGAVNNKAVQEVHSGMVHHRCCACVVITNSRFTKGARELALSTNCILIGEDEFIDFVSGKVNFC